MLVLYLPAEKNFSMGQMSTLVEVTCPANPDWGDRIVTVKLAINTFAWLQIKNEQQTSRAILRRIRKALVLAGGRPPDPLLLAHIKIMEVPPTTRPVV